MLLETNKYDRGFIALTPIDVEHVDFELQIGVFENRCPYARPQEVWKEMWTRVDISGANSHSEMALKVLDSVGLDMLEKLPQSAASM